MRTSPLLSPAAPVTDNGTATPTVTPREAFGRALDALALRLYRAKVNKGVSVAQQAASLTARAEVLTAGSAFVGSADPSWSTRCTDGIDRSPVAVWDFIAGCRNDSKAATATLNRMASAAATRNPTA